MPHTTEQRAGITRRRFMKYGLYSAGLLLANRMVSPCLGETNSASDATAPAVDAGGADAVRRVWVFSDVHIGFNAAATDDRDGAFWLQHAVADIREHGGPISWVMSLGDISHTGEQETYDQYVAIRRGAGFGSHWFEMTGNHDHAGFSSGRWKAFATPPQQRFILVDGNVVWICFGVEASGAGGKISDATLRWLREAISQNQERNVIVCSHQAVWQTVHNSKKDWRALYCPSATDPAPEMQPSDEDPAKLKRRETTDAALQRVARVVDDLRVDLWLCGHIHAGKRTADAIVRRGRTTFINASAVTHAYGTKTSNSFVMEFHPGERMMNARYRNHDTGKFDEAFGAVVEFPHPCNFSGPPKLEIATDAHAAVKTPSGGGMVFA